MMSLNTGSPRLPRAVRRLLLGACLAGAALVGLPSMASAASTCTYLPDTQVVRVLDGSGFGASLRITRSGQSIAVADGTATRLCGGATVFNTSRISVTATEGQNQGSMIIDNSGGPLAPGSFAESDGTSEIEVLINTARVGLNRLSVIGTPGSDTFRVGAQTRDDVGGPLTNRVMVGPDADTDMLVFDTGLSTPGFVNAIGVDGGGGDDFISGRGGYPASFPLAASAHLDLNGQGGRDTLVDGLSFDFLNGGSENDTLFSADGNPTGFADSNNGGDGFDSATANSNDGLFNVEHVSLAEVGRLRLSPAVVAARPGTLARLQLRWTHPEAWRRLRNVEVRLYRGTERVGTIAMSPRRERIESHGKVRLARGASAVTHRGKAVIARLALRVPKAMAGEQLRVDVEATDHDGRHQLEPSAGLITIK
jgi:hypothetical protein